MHRILTTSLLAVIVTASAVPAYAADSPDTLVTLEATWSKAMVAKDTATIDSIVAADWMGQNPSGKMTGKSDVVGEVKSGKLTMSAMANRDVHARIFGDMAVVQGADDETSTYDGNDTSGAYTWTDVFQKRGGKWLAIASQVTPVMK